MSSLLGPNLKNIYIINGECYSIDQLTPQQIKQIEDDADRRAYSVFCSNLLATYGADLEANIIINTDRSPYELKVFDKNNLPLSRELIKG
jgi:hypothetical protein